MDSKVGGGIGEGERGTEAEGKQVQDKLKVNRQGKLDRMPKTNLHHTAFQSHTHAAALAHRERMRELDKVRSCV